MLEYFRILKIFEIFENIWIFEYFLIFKYFLKFPKLFFEMRQKTEKKVFFVQFFTKIFKYLNMWIFKYSKIFEYLEIFEYSEIFRNIWIFEYSEIFEYVWIFHSGIEQYSNQGKTSEFSALLLTVWGSHKLYYCLPLTFLWLGLSMWHIIHYYFSSCHSSLILQNRFFLKMFNWVETIPSICVT